MLWEFISLSSSHSLSYVLDLLIMCLSIACTARPVPPACNAEAEGQEGAIGYDYGVDTPTRSLDSCTSEPIVNYGGLQTTQTKALLISSTRLVIGRMAPPDPCRRL